METAIPTKSELGSMNDTGRSRHNQCVLVDWGDTVMRVLPELPGPMEKWPIVEVVPGAVEAIEQLRRDAFVCLATNAADSDERAIGAALARVGLDTHFDRIFCFENVGCRKPTEAYYQTVLDTLGLSPDRVFMIGDDFDVDVVGATAVGIRSVWLNLLSGEERSGSLYTTANSFVMVLEALEELGFVGS